jgi:hypothetical protein
MRRHYRSWLSFANDTWDLGLSLDQLLFVTSCDKLSHWASAVFSENSSQIATFQVSSYPDNSDVTSQSSVLSGEWDVAHSSVKRRWSPVDRPADKFDQTVFIRGFRMQERLSPDPEMTLATGQSHSNRVTSSGGLRTRVSALWRPRRSSPSSETPQPSVMTPVCRVSRFVSLGETGALKLLFLLSPVVSSIRRSSRAPPTGNTCSICPFDNISLSSYCHSSLRVHCYITAVYFSPA